MPNSVLERDWLRCGDSVFVCVLSRVSDSEKETEMSTVALGEMVPERLALSVF